MDFDKIFQESEMTQEEKMDAWHNGTRGFNIKAASTSKLRGNLAICKKKKYKSEVSAIEAELKSRGSKVSESRKRINEWEGRRPDLYNEPLDRMDPADEAKKDAILIILNDYDFSIENAKNVADELISQGFDKWDWFDFIQFSKPYGFLPTEFREAVWKIMCEASKASLKENASNMDEVEAPVEHTAEVKETETTSNPLWKVEALGDDEVRELFNNIRNGDNGLDKQFVEKIYEIFPDMPHAVRILRGGSVDESGDWDKFTFEEGRLFEDSLVYYENERKSGVCDYQNLFDYIGDGKNPFEIYVATYSHSDGMEDTVILYYGDDWYMVCPWDEEKIKDALMDFITDVEDGTKVLKRCYHKEFNQSLTSSNKSIF